jgi:hypothetical protein
MPLSVLVKIALWATFLLVAGNVAIALAQAVFS